jgi:hypothetical protein
MTQNSAGCYTAFGSSKRPRTVLDYYPSIVYTDSCSVRFDVQR